MQYVALLRGVNVGGGNKVRMADLRAHATALGFDAPRTYLVSGNLIFGATGACSELAGQLRQVMARERGVDVPVLVLDAATLRQSVADCPFAPKDPRQVHIAYLLEDPAPDWPLYEMLKLPDDGLTIRDRIAWLHTPGGYGRSRLAARLDRVLGADFTARNLRTATALCEMLDAGANA